MQRGRGRYDRYGGYNSNNGNYNANSGGYAYGSGYGYGQQQQGSPWQSAQASSQLDELDLQLEMMKRKRQMLHEQRQLLEEQKKLDRMQGIQNPSPWNKSQSYRQFSSQTQQSYNQYSGFSNLSYRPNKRPAKESPWQEHSQPKRFAPSAGAASFPQAKANWSEPQRYLSKSSIDREVGPVRPPPVLYLGYNRSSKTMKNKIHAVVKLILDEMRSTLMGPPRNLKLENYQYHAMKRRITERVDKMMMNKPMAAPAVMHGVYRKSHTAKGDLRLIQSMQALSEAECENPAPGPVTPLTMTQKPEGSLTKQEVQDQKVTATLYMKENLQKALDTKLTEILDKISKIYEDEPGETASKATPDSDGAEPATAAEGTANAASAESADGADKQTVTAEMDHAKLELPADFENLLDELLKRKVPQMLPQYKSYILSILARDPALAEVNLKAIQNPTTYKDYKPLKFVKIYSRPSLPLREVMQTFLQNFEPGSIKKHRTDMNLLFVGVPAHRFEELLLHNGSSVGGRRLAIIAAAQEGKKKIPANGAKETKKAEKANETVENKDLKTGNDTNDTAKNENRKHSETLKEAIDDLDDEIDELLTSIKTAGEDNAPVKADKAGENLEDTGDNIEHNGSDVNDIGDNGTAEENVEARAVDAEDIGDNGTAEENVEARAVDAEENTGDLAVEKNASVEEKDDKTEEKNAPDTPANAIRTRRSSRLPQKN